MSKILYVASTNPGKLRDFAVAAEAHQLLILPVPGLHDIPAPPEDEPDFEGNAREKALYYSRFAPGAVVLADDSGLEVDALHGEPGVRSARYASDAAFLPPLDPDAASLTTDQRNNLYLLTRLKTVPEAERSARYRCALAAARDGQILALATGTVEGSILSAPRGTGGFGYDPLFLVAGQGQTMAEIDLAAKHAFSHRGRAFRALLATLARDHPECLYD